MSTAKAAGSLWVLIGLSLGAAPAHALDILLTNDDGFEAASLHALYQRLEQNGHRVIVSAPTQDNSGQAGALELGKALGPIPLASRAGTIPAGAPGVGSMPSDPDVYYVDSTPAVSMLHGLDVAAPRTWGRAPDLVISGVNYGLNGGLTTLLSGTIGAAIAAMNRGVPAIAVNANYARGSYKPYTQLLASDYDYEVADFIVSVVRALENARKSSNERLLPERAGLNINLPVFEPGTGALVPVRMAKAGTACRFTPTFVMNLATEPGAPTPLPPALPGLAIYVPGEQGTEPNSMLPTDDDPDSEYNVVLSGAIAISVLHGSYQADAWTSAAVRAQLHSIFAPH